jgi:hypothetical protein
MRVPSSLIVPNGSNSIGWPMGSKRRLRLAIVGALGWAASCLAQQTLWPEFFEPFASQPVESTQTLIQTATTANEGEILSKTHALIRSNLPNRFFEQQLLYDLEHDPYLKRNEHFISLPGMVVRKNLPMAIDFVGLSYQPDMIITHGEGDNRLEGRLDFGPTLQITPWSIPWQLGGGFSGTVWNSRTLGPRLDAFDSDLGWYATSSIHSQPLHFSQSEAFFSSSIYAKSHETAEIFKGDASLLLRHGLPTGDSLFLFYTDTLISGNDAILSERGELGQVHYVQSPDVLLNSFELNAALTTTPRLHLAPRFSIGYTQRNLTYSDATHNTDDELRRRFSALAELHTDSAAWLRYAGALRIEFGSDDRLYHENFEAVLPSIALTTKYRQNLWDARHFNARSSHLVEKYLPSGHGFSYLFSIARSSQTYPSYYFKSRASTHDSIKNDQSRDLITFRHHLEIPLLATTRCNAIVLGEYNKTIISYLDASRSALNTSDSTYIVGMRLRLALGERFALEDTLRVSTDITRYHFPHIHRGDPPSLSRDFFSNFGLLWQPTPQLSLLLNWREHYYDRGKWYGAQYLDSVLLDSLQGGDNVNFYGILAKTWDHTLRLQLRWQVQTWVEITCGGEINDVNPLVWVGESDVRSYQLDNSDRGYRLTPFVGTQMNVGSKLALTAQLAPRLYGGAGSEFFRNHPVRERFLNLELQAQMIF